MKNQTDVELVEDTQGKLIAFVNRSGHYASDCVKEGNEWVCKDYGCRHIIDADVIRVQCGLGTSYRDMEAEAHRDDRSYQFYKDWG